MPVYKRLRGIGSIALYSALMFGCSHAHRNCDCSSGTSLGTTDAAAPMPNSPVVAFEPPAKHDDQPTTAPVESKAGIILINAVAANGTTGTVPITTTQAEKMGIRPGFTPGAIYPLSSGADQITPRQDDDPRGTGKGESQ